MRIKNYKDINSYIKDYPKSVQVLLKQMRAAIKKIAPKATEAISYGIPTFKLNGNLVHFGGFKNHVSFFPGSSPIRKFKKQLSKYKTARGTIQFPLDQQLPLSLILKIVQFRVKENRETTVTKILSSAGRSKNKKKKS